MVTFQFGRCQRKDFFALYNASYGRYSCHVPVVCLTRALPGYSGHISAMSLLLGLRSPVCKICVAFGGCATPGLLSDLRPKRNAYSRSPAVVCPISIRASSTSACNGSERQATSANALHGCNAIFDQPGSKIKASPQLLMYTNCLNLIRNDLTLTSATQVQLLQSSLDERPNSYMKDWRSSERVCTAVEVAVSKPLSTRIAATARSRHNR